MRRLILSICVLIPVSATLKAVPSAQGYADEQSCSSCHADHVATYRHSAHALTTSLPSVATIKGDFTAGKNTMATHDPNLSFLMEKIGESYFETATLLTPTKTMQRRERIDLVVGSGRKGQTYLYWDKDQLFELPVSCWVKTGTWMNSPGYPDGTANFDRGVSDRCLECHATTFETRQPPRNRFVRTSVVPGISCQKCHGPAADHVARMQSGSPGNNGLAIVNPARLPRERQMDLCSLCHAGVGKAQAPALSYTAGEPLAKYLVIPPGDASRPIDPHGSQVQTLTTSRCYRESETLTCLTCHDVHREQRQLADYSGKCLTCHQPSACGEFAKRGETITHACIDCHMPLEKTAKIVMRLNGERYQPEVRTHRIGIYPTSGQMPASEPAAPGDGH